MVGLFVRLKIRLYVASMRGSVSRILLFLAAVLTAAWLAFGGFVLLAVVGRTDDPVVGGAVAGLLGAGVVLCWLVLPILVFGVDGTVDPSRFALLPVTRGGLARGMLAAALVGLAPLANLVAFAGLPLGLLGSPAAAATAVVGVVLTLLLCVALARFATTALAGLLVSRRGRDVGLVAATLLGVSIYPLSIAVQRVTQDGTVSVDTFVPVGRAIGWTPPGWAFSAPFDVAAGDPLVGVAKLALTGLLVVLLVAAWVRLVERELTRPPSTSAGATGGGLFVGPVARRLPRTPTGAVAGRELALWRRDPRRRLQLITTLVIAVTVCLAPALVDESPFLLSPAYAVAIVAWFGGLSAANMYGYDGNAYWLHVAAGGGERADAAGRLLALALVYLPAGLLMSLVLAAALGDAAALPGAIGLGAALFGTTAVTSAVTAVFGAYALPETSNPFVTTGNGNVIKILLQIGGGLVAPVLGAPVFALLLLRAVWPPAGWVALVVGLGEGVLLVVLAIRVQAGVLAGQGPSLLARLAPARS